ncbi:MAG: adenosine deaminase [Bacteroidales bacterium]
MTKDSLLNTFIEKLPKAELHLHIEGTLEPELMLTLAQRNKVEIGYSSVEDLKEAYSFTQLQDFLDIYYAGAAVLLKEQDFYDLTMAYLQRAKEQNIIHAEIFFDPQTHTDRAVPFSEIIGGIKKALAEGEKNLGITSRLIMCFLRHRSEKEAFKVLEEALPYKNDIVAVGLDSSELGNPPSKFVNVFAKAREDGFKVVAHAGEEGTTEYIQEAINLLKVDRIDHGNASIENEEMLLFLKGKQIPLTLCPLSNIALCVIDDMKKHPIKDMLDRGLLVTVNSDDPAYFGGYVNENYKALADAFSLSKAELLQLAENSFKASFLDATHKQKYIDALKVYGETFPTSIV